MANKSTAPVLSIGLILKNEEKTLRRCLDSIKPIMEAISCELIITDTGSTDSTVEIAKEYTDKIQHFIWCNDFSAARNMGLKAAKGKWFLFLDGDEWFEDTREIIEFFNTKESNKYKSALYLQRNYLGHGEEEYTDNRVMRLFRRSGVEFQGIIHEYVEARQPSKLLKNSFVHHYGYMRFDEVAHKIRHERNLSLLKKEIETFPDNLRTIAGLIRQYKANDELDEAVEWTKIGIPKAEKQKSNRYYYTYYKYLIQNLIALEKFQEAYKSLTKYFDEKQNPKEDFASEVDIRFSGFQICGKLSKAKEAVIHGKEYLRLVRLFKEGELETEDRVEEDPVNWRPEEWRQVLIYQIITLIRLGQKDEAFVQVTEYTDSTAESLEILREATARMQM